MSDLQQAGGLGQPPRIGVGMGGSCPECRAPIELGQSYCLECGSPIRFRRKAKKQRPSGPAGAPATVAAIGAPPARRPKGFPWLSFLGILGLVAAGIVFAYVELDDSGAGKKKGSGKKKEDAPITGLVPTTNGSTTPTVTLQDCQVALPSDSATATAGGGDFSDSSVNGSPSAPPDSSSGDAEGLFPGDSSSTSTGFTGATDATSTPSSTSTATGTAVTVDQNGNLCPINDGSTDGTTNPSTDGSTLTDPNSTSTTDGTGTTFGGSDTSTSGTSTTGTTDQTDGVSATEWPKGKEGFTVVLASYPQSSYSETDANNRAAQAQADGLSAGVIDSNDYASLTQNVWIVFSGVYNSEAEADVGLKEAQKKGYTGAYVRPVRA